MTYPPFRWCGSGIFVRAIVWRGNWHTSPASWLMNALSAEWARRKIVDGRDVGVIDLGDV